MGAASNLNRNIINWEIDTKGLTFVKANELPLNVEFPFLGCWVSPDNGYGEGGVIISEIDGEKKLVNAPKSFVGSIKLLRQTEAYVEQIKTRKLNFKVETFDTKFKRKGYSIKLVDVE